MEEGLNLLKQINHRTNKKYSEKFTLSGKTSLLSITLDVPIKLDNEKNYCVSLGFFTVYNSIKNVSDKNNSFNYSNIEQSSLTKVRKEIKLKEGSYEIHNINKEIQRLTGMDEKKIKIFPIQHLNRVGLILDGTIEVKVEDDSILKMLGFDNGTYKEKYNVASKIASIAPFNSINLQCNLINSGYIGKEMKSILFTIPTFTVPVGYKITERPQYKQCFPLINNYLKEIKISVINEFGKLIDFSGEEIMVEIFIEEM